MMINNHPNDFTFIQYHGADVYEIPFGVWRRGYYSIAGYHTCWFDGKLKAEGAYQNDTQQYNWYNSLYNSRKTVATDVLVEVGGEQLAGQTFRITVRVSLDSNGTAKTVRVLAANILDHYPSSTDNRYRNCAVAPTLNTPYYIDVALQPGDVVDVLTWDLTFSSTSWSHQSDIRIIAWAQKQAANGGSGAGEVWNAKMMSWPFSTLPPLNAMGDLNCDGVVNFDDINPFVLALTDPVAYSTTFPDCDIALADCNLDTLIDFNDIACFVALLGG